MLQARLELSERRACRGTGQHRSTQRRVAARGRGDDALRTELHAFSRGHPRWDYRRAWATLREEGWTVNRKRVQRLWREEGLRVPAKRRKRQRPGHSAVPAARLRAERPNHVWALDFQFDQTADGRGPEAAQHRRRAHAGGARDRGRQEHHRRRHGLNARGDRRPARDGACVHPLRQRARAHGQRPARLVPVTPAQAAATSSPARRGRTHSSSRSTAGCATSSWPSSSSTACSRRRCCSRTGGSSTTRSARTAAWAGSPRLPTAERWEAQLHAGLS